MRPTKILTVKELIEKLKEFSDDTKVLFKADFRNGYGDLCANYSGIERVSKEIFSYERKGYFSFESPQEACILDTNYCYGEYQIFDGYWEDEREKSIRRDQQKAAMQAKLLKLNQDLEIIHQEIQKIDTEAKSREGLIQKLRYRNEEKERCLSKIRSLS